MIRRPHFPITVILAVSFGVWFTEAVVSDIPRSHKRDRGDLPSDAICLDCHGDYHRKANKFPHESFVNDPCTRCHELHEEYVVTEGKPPVKHEPTLKDIALCYECHHKSSLGRSHPVGKNVIDDRSGKMITCSSHCHEPHGSDFPDMLREDGRRELCIGCHEEFAKKVRHKRKRRFRFF